MCANFLCFVCDGVLPFQEAEEVEFGWEQIDEDSAEGAFDSGHAEEARDARERNYGDRRRGFRR